MISVQTLAELTTSQIVNSLVLGLALAAFATSILAFVAKKDSGVRFAVWFSAMIAIASLFFLSPPILRSVTAVPVHRPELSLPAHWAIYIFFVWAAIAAIGLARVARGLWRVRSLKKSALPVDQTVLASLDAAQLQHGKRRFAVCASEQVRVPAAMGFFHPVVILPAWALRELSTEELNSVVLHEAAHLSRWDDWTNLFQKIVRAVLFFHPAVWWIDSRLSLEREMSCDDIVVMHSENARRYAACLVTLAEKASHHHSLALVQAAVSHLRHTAQRISKILDGRRRHAGSGFAPGFSALAVFATIAFVAAQHTPELVGFRNSSSEPAQLASSDSGVDPVPMARAIPASLHSNPPMQAAPATKLQRTQKPVKKVIPRPRTDWSAVNESREEARLDAPRSTVGQVHPVAVNASMNTDAVPAYIYFVTQTEQFDSFGNVTVTTSVWRVPVGNISHAQSQSGVLPHST